jgi:hypothetical protein
MSDQKVEQPTQPVISWIKSPDGVREVYANLVHLVWSLDDIRIRVAQMVESAETRNPGEPFLPAAEERAVVTLPWRCAKILGEQLTAAVKNFEQSNGPIKTDLKLPPSI